MSLNTKVKGYVVGYGILGRDGKVKYLKKTNTPNRITSNGTKFLLGKYNTSLLDEGSYTGDTYKFRSASLHNNTQGTTISSLTNAKNDSTAELGMTDYYNMSGPFVWMIVGSGSSPTTQSMDWLENQILCTEFSERLNFSRAMCSDLFWEGHDSQEDFTHNYWIKANEDGERDNENGTLAIYSNKRSFVSSSYLTANRRISVNEVGFCGRISTNNTPMGNDYFVMTSRVVLPETVVVEQGERLMVQYEFRLIFDLNEKIKNIGTDIYGNPLGTATKPIIRTRYAYDSNYSDINGRRWYHKPITEPDKFQHSNILIDFAPLNHINSGVVSSESSLGDASHINKIVTGYTNCPIVFPVLLTGLYYNNPNSSWSARITSYTLGGGSSSASVNPCLLTNNTLNLPAYQENNKYTDGSDRTGGNDFQPYLSGYNLNRSNGLRLIDIVYGSNYVDYKFKVNPGNEFTIYGIVYGAMQCRFGYYLNNSMVCDGTAQTIQVGTLLPNTEIAITEFKGSTTTTFTEVASADAVDAVGKYYINKTNGQLTIMGEVDENINISCWVPQQFKKKANQEWHFTYRMTLEVE